MKNTIRTLILALILLLSLPLQGQIRIDRFLEQGRLEIQQQKYPKAIQTLSRVILQDPDNYDAWYLRGLSKFYLRDKSGSLRDLTRAIDLNPAVSGFFLLRGIIRDMQGDYYKALEDFTAGLAIDPNNANLYYSRGTTRLRLNNFSHAIEDFNEAIRVNDHLDEAYVNRGVAKSKLLEREGALEDFNQAILLNPFSPDGYSRKGLLYYETEKYSEALISLGEAIYRDSANPQHYYMRALTFYEMEQKDSCISDLNRVLKLDPSHSLSWYNRAIIRAQIGDYEGAILDYEQVNVLQPYHVLSYFNRGLLRNDNGDLSGALFDLDQAVLIYPDFAKAYIARASIKRKLGDLTGAQTDQLLAQEKIQANAGQTKEELALNYADTTIQFEQLITLHSVFNVSFNKQYEEELSLGELLGLERFRGLGLRASTLRLRSGTTLLSQRTLSGDKERSLSGVEGGIQGLRWSDRSFRLQQNTEALIEGFTADTLILVALSRGRDSLFNQGIQVLNEVLWEKPENMSALFARAELRFEMIEFIRSTAMMNEVVPMQVYGDPVKGPARRVDKVDYSQVLDDYNQLLSAHPDLAVVWMNRGMVKVFARDFEGAIKDFRQAITLIPDYSVAWFNLGISLIKTGHKEEGCMCLSEAGELGLERAYRSILLHCKAD